MSDQRNAKDSSPTTAALDAFLAHTAVCGECQQEPHPWAIAFNRYVKLCEVGSRLALAAEPEERQRLIATVNLASEKIYRERRVVTI